MNMMRAARLHEIGGSFSIDEIPIPTPGRQEVLVKVEACGLIPNLRNVVTHFPSWYPFLPLPALPATFGLDSAGTVAAVGDGVTAWKPGDRVYVNRASAAASAVTAGRASRRAATAIPSWATSASAPAPRPSSSATPMRATVNT
jgi:NADPH:quinone reductase-like Zn-dependent oxidoreductase